VTVTTADEAFRRDVEQSTDMVADDAPALGP
jgi:hypothetical protein